MVAFETRFHDVRIERSELRIDRAASDKVPAEQRLYAGMRLGRVSVCFQQCFCCVVDCQGSFFRLCSDLKIPWQVAPRGVREWEKGSVGARERRA